MILESAVSVVLLCLAVVSLRVVWTDWSHFNLTVKLGEFVTAELSAEKSDDE